MNNKVDLLLELIKTNFKMRYYNSFLGVLWVLIKPYSTFLVLYIIWSKANLGAAGTTTDYAIYLLIGIVSYTFINELVTFGQAAMLDKANVILKVNFSRQIAVVAALSNAVVNLAINFLFVVIIFGIRGGHWSLSGILVIVLCYVVFFVWGLGLALFTSIITVRLRDIKNILDLAMFLLLYVTPIFYEPKALLGEGLISDIISANPIGILIQQIRAGIGVYGTTNFPLILAMLATGIVFLYFGWKFFQKYIKRIAEFI